MKSSADNDPTAAKMGSKLCFERLRTRIQQGILQHSTAQHRREEPNFLGPTIVALRGTDIANTSVAKPKCAEKASRTTAKDLA